MKTKVRIKEAGKNLFCVEQYVVVNDQEMLSFRIFVDILEIETKIIDRIIAELVKRKFDDLLNLSNN